MQALELIVQYIFRTLFTLMDNNEKVGYNLRKTISLAAEQLNDTSLMITASLISIIMH